MKPSLRASMTRLLLACVAVALTTTPKSSLADERPFLDTGRVIEDAANLDDGLPRAAFRFARQPAPADSVGAMLLAQSSKDELFGSAKTADEKPKSRLSGFMESTVAYTYENPSHWSRAVGRLQLTGQGELADQVKWKISARADADIVYFTSDFYLDRVKRDQRVDFFLKENYIDFSHGSWEFRLGARDGW